MTTLAPKTIMDDEDLECETVKVIVKWYAIVPCFALEEPT